jgi:hypothetical protein
MAQRTLGICVCSLAILLLTACHGSRSRELSSSQELAISPNSDDHDRVWRAAQETLRRHNFVLDRVDRRERLISTLPETSKHFFEFWRHDVDTAHDFWESVLNPIRRWVEVSIPAGEDSAGPVLSVVVHKERLSAPDRQFNRTGAAYQYFSDSLPSTTGIERVTREHDRWLAMGRDAAMEDYLLRHIIARAEITNR